MLGQDWKLNQCSDFITLHGDGAYFIALLIYSNKCQPQQPNENTTYHPTPVPHLHLSLGRRVMEKTKKEAGRG